LPEALPLLPRVDGSAGIFESPFDSWLCFPVLLLPLENTPSRYPFGYHVQVRWHGILWTNRSHRERSREAYELSYPRQRASRFIPGRAWFEGLQIVQEEDGTSRLSGFLKDQAALYALLLRIRSLGLTLLSLESDARTGRARSL